MKSLPELADHYGTNKAEYGYTYWYDRLIPRDATRLLEVGIGAPGLSGGKSLHAASLKMWEEYFPDATIYGVDFRREILLNEGRIRSCWGDVNDTASMIEAATRMGGNFDAIIDDAVHELPAQINCMRALLPFVVPDGWYFVEDVANGDPQEIIAALPAGYFGVVKPCKLPFVMVQRSSTPLSIS